MKGIWARVAAIFEVTKRHCSSRNGLTIATLESPAACCRFLPSTKWRNILTVQSAWLEMEVSKFT
jgi:hypothetical protein